MRNVRYIFIAVFLFCASAAFPAVAQTIKIAAGEWAPYVSSDMDDYGFVAVGDNGFAAEIVFYAFLSVGIETEFEFLSWDKCEALVKDGSVFAAFPRKRTQQREAFALFSDPIAMSRSVFFYLKENLREFKYDGRQ